MAPESVQVPVPDFVSEVVLTKPELVITALLATVAAALKVTVLVAALMALMVVDVGMPVPVISLPTVRPTTEPSTSDVLAVLAAVATVVPVVVLSIIAPTISPVPSVEPERVKVLLPTPVAPTKPVNFKSPVPDWSITAPPAVPGRSRFRSVVLPVPIYERVVVVVPVPMEINPFAAFVATPMELLPAPTALMEVTARLPPLTKVLPM